jgi:hypothetical protein
MFHEGGCISHIFAKRINLPGRLLGIVPQGQIVPIHVQEKCAATFLLRSESFVKYAG